MKKFLLFGLIAAVLPAVAEEAADRKTATSLKYVEHELDTRQDKFTAEQNKAMEYTDSAGDVQKRAVKSDLGSDTSDTSLPMVGGVNVKLNMKQDDIAAINDHTAVTYTGQPGGIGRKGIYQTTGTYTDQSDNLIDAKTFNAALKNGLDNEFKCKEFKPDTDLCWVYSIHNPTTDNTLLPPGYTPLEYIESDGHQWIDTGIKGHMNYTYELDFQQSDASYYRNWGVFNQSDWQGQNMSFTWIDSTKWGIRWEAPANGNRFLTLARVDANRHILRIVDGEVYFDGVDKGRSEGHDSSFVFNYNLFLGTANPAGTTPTSNAKSKYYSYRVWDANGDLIQNFIPARQDSDNKVGMYDTVSGRFFPSVPANTNFAAGPEATNNNLYIPQNQ